MFRRELLEIFRAHKSVQDQVDDGATLVSDFDPSQFRAQQDRVLLRLRTRRRRQVRRALIVGGLVGALVYGVAWAVERWVLRRTLHRLAEIVAVVNYRGRR